MNALKLAKEHRIRKTWKELWDGVQQMTPAQPSLVCHTTLSYALHVHIFSVQISSENKFLVTHGQILHKRTTMAVLIKVTTLTLLIAHLLLSYNLVAM